MDTPTATATHKNGFRAHIEDAGHLVAAASNPVALIDYVLRTIKDRPWMAALAVGGFVALMMARRRPRR